VAATLARWRSRSLELPDYYVVIDPDGWDATRRHSYLGYLAAAAPSRVVAAGSDLLAAIGHLGTGRWWPELDRLLDAVDRVVPDRVGLPDGAALEQASDRPGARLIVDSSRDALHR
jgi:hypothetical protein